jgi:NADH-quinone oxidoreductase subunit A
MLHNILKLNIGFYYNYSFFLIYILISISLVIILLLATYLLNSKEISNDKTSPYECGFEPYEATGQKSVDLHFYVVGILFLVFDLEVAFLFPWAVSLQSIGLFGFFIMIFFLFLITLGFIYEWSRGALDWSTQSYPKS